MLYYRVMKSLLTHLPEEKQQQLQWAVETIRAHVPAEMILLFGSFARGDWVEDLDPETLQYRYRSDFDLLVVTETAKQATVVESNTELNRLLISNSNRPPISVIAEDIDFVNSRIRKSQYFYIDIKREGIVLFDSNKYALATPKELSAKDRHHLAQEDYDYWQKNAVEFFVTYKFMLSQDYLNNAAFQLHQATERLYGAILLVFTRCKPSSHDLKKLGQRVASIDPVFLTVFPQGTEEECERFKLLRKAYVDARYKPSYRITKDELAWLAERVEHLQALTERLCKAQIASYLKE